MKIDIIKSEVQFSNTKVYIQKSNGLCASYFHYIIKICTWWELLSIINLEYSYHMQVCPSGKNISTVISSPNYTSLPSIVVKIEESGLDLFYFSFHFYFWFDLFFYFLFLEQLGLGLIGHAITSVTTWWYSHKTDHETGENMVEDSRTNDIIQHGPHMLTSCSTHGGLG